MKKKKTILILLFILCLIALTVGVSLAIFNYTKKGASNIIAVGDIDFISTEGNTINLTNAYPVSSNNLLNNSNVGSVTLSVAGGTTYDKGIEYLISAVDVTNTVNNKHVPIGINVTVSNLGTSDSNYFNHRGGNSSIYKVLAGSTVSEGDQLVVGYITKGASGINGTVTISAYIDGDKLAVNKYQVAGSTAVTDIPNLNLDYGTVVLSETEWNSLHSNGISFKIKVEANEGIWVLNTYKVNDLNNPGVWNNSSFPRSSVREMHFIGASQSEIDKRYNAAQYKIDLTLSGGEGSVKGWLEDDIMYVASEGRTYFGSWGGWFSGFTNLELLDLRNADFSNGITGGFLSGLNSLKTLDMSGVNIGGTSFTAGNIALAYNLETANLSGINAPNVTNVSYLFNGLSHLRMVDLSDAYLPSVTNMSGMFNGCSSLETIYVSDMWNVSGVTTSSGMFNNCTSIIGGNGTEYDSGKIDKTMAVIDNSSHEGYLTYKQDKSQLSTNAINKLPRTGDFSSSVRNNVKEIKFIKMDSATMNEKYTDATIKSDITYNNEGTVLTWLEEDETDNKYVMYVASDGITYFTTGSQLFMDYNKVNKITFSNIDTSRVTDMSFMFYHLQNLTSVNLGGFDTSNVTTMSQMFSDCSSLQSVNVSSFNTDNVTDMARMFYGCTSLTSLSLRGKGGNLLQRTDYLTSGCTNLITIDMSGFNFGVANNIVYTFGSNIQTINLSKAKFSGTMADMFKNLTSLTSINLNGADTSNVTNMFAVFYGCTALTTLDLSGFNTGKVTNTSEMFNGCTNLETIYVNNNWDVSDAAQYGNMFYNCTSIEGGAGTPYDASHTGNDYAVIDGGLSSETPGYLTLKTN